MDIDKVLKKCELKKIRFVNLEFQSGVNWLGKYFINNNISEEEQVITLIHELLHDLPKYKDEHGHMCDSLIYPNRELHEKLEEEALKIYNTRLDIRNIVSEKLKLAKINS